MKNFFDRQKEVCNKNREHCAECSLMAYCYDGIFQRNTVVSLGEAAVLSGKVLDYERSN
ncbi:MAG: hypothetical protein NC318_04965 [Blautia sp.]|nr:hypothetical protein [Lachnoclostridium sp.]MCM1210933.1 hypothetical protein [Blautia sp.]